MSQDRSINLYSKCYISYLPTEILYYLLDQLDDKALQNLSWTCQYLYRLVRINRFGIVSPFWEDAKVSNSEILPASSYRDGVVINNVLYIPVLTTKNPYCASIDFGGPPLKLVKIPIKLVDKYEPCRFIATAAIDNLLFIFGGENVLTGKPTNEFYQLNIKNFELKKICKSRNIPKPRMRHSLNPIGSFKLALFGGQCYTNGMLHDTKDFAIYDVKENSWTVIYNEIPFFPSRRSDHSTMFVNGKLYIYGGRQITSSLNHTYIDPDIWEYDALKSKWTMYSNSSLPNFIISENLIPTSGKYPPKKCGAAIFPIRKQIAILGGNGWNGDNKEENNSWQFMEILSSKHAWAHVRVKGMPLADCVAIFANCKVGVKDIFILGKDQREEKIVMGWLKDEQQ